MTDERDEEIAALKARLAALEADKPAPPTPTPVQQTPSSGFSAGFTGCFGVLAAIIFVVLALSAVGTCTGNSDSGSALSSSAYKAPPAPPAPAWSYSTYTDEMSGQPATTACIDSSAQVRLDFPYEPQYPTLCVRQSPRYGQDVIVRLPSGGQFLCQSYRECIIRVKFGEGEIQSFSAIGPSDGSSDSIFVVNDRRFVTAMRNAETVRIEAEIYQSGAPTMVFPVKDFDAERAGL